ncbi:MAG: FHA domain-containing protein [Planctomycetes bacterium]|nr:FHA domain-containing protein [Planctomycetota bacterium]
MTGFLVHHDGRRVPVTHDAIVGRVAGCPIHVDDAKVSRRHARFVVTGSVVEIEDLGSANGTLLNGHPVQRRVVRDGDELTFGTTVLVYREPAPAPAPGRPDAPRPPAGPAPSQPRDAFEVLEFEDEVVEVRAQTPPPPAPAAAPARAAPPAPGPARAPAAQGGRVGGILQFSRKDDKGGGLRDDVAQMGGGLRWLAILGGVALAAGLAYLAMTLTRG